MTSATGMRQVFQDMNLQELEAMRALIADIESKREQEIKDIYGEDLTRIVGYRTIDAIPKVKAEDVNLNKDSGYIGGIKPCVLGNRSTARGLMEPGRAFIAIKVDLLDPQTRKLAATVVEVVHQRYCFNPDNYITATYVIDNEGNRYESGLYRSQGMNQKEMEVVSDLLKGKEIVALWKHIPAQECFLMKISSK
jgi:hypothetical protein